MALFDEKITSQLIKVLSEMKNRVKLLYFTDKDECPECEMIHSFLDEIISLSPKIDLIEKEIKTDPESAKKYGIDKIPAIAFLYDNDDDTRMRFYGLPGGYEINSFISGLLEASGKKQEIPQDLMERIKAIDKKIHIQVFISLGCPYCPTAVSIAHRLAMENENIIADMIESGTFVELSEKYDVTSVPKIVINETHEFIGAQSLEDFLDEIEKV